MDLDAKQEATLLKLADEGMAHELLAERYGIATTSVHTIVAKIRARMGRAPGSYRPRRSDEEKAKIIALYATGATATQVGQQFGCSRNSILGIWHRAGVLGKRQKPQRRRGGGK